MTSRNIQNYINGQWVAGGEGHTLAIENPATAGTIGQVPLSTPGEMDQAIAAAKAAFPAWSATPVTRRAELLLKLASAMRADSDNLTRIVSEENGKSLPDARAEVKRAIENLEVACGMPVLSQGSKLVGGAVDIDGEVIRLPVGVFGMIAPFNFPLMVPFWFFPYAVATGNTYVIKPSEQAPLSMHRVAELVEECRFPAGVFNLVHGDRTAAEQIVRTQTFMAFRLSEHQPCVAPSPWDVLTAINAARLWEAPKTIW